MDSRASNPGSPLIFQPISYEPIEVRLAAMHAAIAAGADPNELGGRRNPGIGRPLHYAICDSASVDYNQLKQNLPIVELLLEAGADPRLLNATGKSPIDELEAWFREYNKDHSKWATQDLELQPFFASALQAMKEVADQLDGEPA